MDEQKGIKDIKTIVRRRKIGFIIPFVFIFILSAVIAFVLPPIYLSQATILIESQQIPQEYVQTTITSYAEERLEMITQQIMSRSKLMEMITKLNLYPEMRDRYTTEEIIEEMREDILLETISADIIDRKTGRPGITTIAFTLSYEGKNPSIVQKVASILTSLYLEENLRVREQRASSITSFLKEESDALKEQMELIQGKIGEFKKAHTGELPEYNQFNMQAIEQLDRKLDNLDMQIRSLQERKILLEGQLSSVDPLMAVVTDDGKTMMNPTERLKYLRLQLISLQGSLSEKHPDMKRLKREIQELEAQVGKSDDSIEKIRKFEDLKGQLAALKGKLGSNHPDVQKLSKEVQALSKNVENLKTEKVVSDIEKQRPDNPAYINIETQISSATVEIKSLIQEKNRVDLKIAQYQRKIENAPLIEKEYVNLLRDYDNAKNKYNEIVHKLMEARVARGMEETQRGEKFTIVDPAQLPEKPYKPNRLVIVLIGFVLALGAGVGIAAAKESLDTSIMTADEFSSLTTAPVLSVIPLLKSKEERRNKRIKIAAGFLAAVGIIAVGLYLVDLFVMPLDIIWVKVQRRVLMAL